MLDRNELQRLSNFRQNEFAPHRVRVEKEPMDEYSVRLAKTLLFLLKSHGKFLYDGTRYYYQDTVINRNYLIGSIKDNDSEFHRYLTFYYNMATSDTHFQKIYSRLLVRIELIAKFTILHEFACYKPQKNILYIRNNPREIIKITSEGKVSIIPNGTAGVMMKSGAYLRDIDLKESEIENIEYDPTYLDSMFFNKIHFQESEGYTAKHQKTLLKKYIFSFFFKEILDKKPILVAQGETGSGKTALMQNIGRLFWGEKFSVTGLPENQRDLVNLLINNLFIVLDNVDERPPAYFLDSITSITTGGVVSYRPLYQDPTAENLRIKPNCWIGISSRTPLFNRSDVANRSVVIKLNKPEKMSYDSHNFESEIIEYFGGTWYYILGELMQIVKNLKKHQDNISMNYRMIEFANFAIRSSSNKQEMEEVKNVLSDSVKAQLEFATQDKPIIEALKDIAAFPGGLMLSSDDLLRRLQEEYGIVFRNSNQLGWAIKSVIESLKEYISIEKRIMSGRIYYMLSNKKDGQEQYSFGN